jgi:hypothetical protein
MSLQAIALGISLDINHFPKSQQISHQSNTQHLCTYRTYLFFVVALSACRRTHIALLDPKPIARLPLPWPWFRFGCSRYTPRRPCQADSLTAKAESLAELFQRRLPTFALSRHYRGTSLPNRDGGVSPGDGTALGPWRACVANLRCAGASSSSSDRRTRKARLLGRASHCDNWDQVGTKD